MKFQKTWRWPKSIEEFIEEKAEGFVIHVCNGESQLGDVRLDRYTKTTDIIADFGSLPIKTGVADTVVCDPPWETPYHLRSPMVFELRRILKLGGLLIFAALWLPHAPGLRRESIWIPDSGWHFTNVCPISLYRKTKESMFGDR